VDTRENLFLSETHGVSGRSVILEDDGTSAWLHLTERGGLRPVADAWVYNRVTGVHPDDVQLYRGAPPPAPITVVDGQEVCPSPEQHRWELRWEEDGEAVTLLRDSEPMAFLSSRERRGMSRHLVVECGWGTPLRLAPRKLAD